jgi:hypothetical protein
VTKLGVLITVSVTVSALILIGFLWVMYLGMESSSASTVTRGGDRRRIRTRRALDFGTRTNILASFPGRCRSE